MRLPDLPRTPPPEDNSEALSGTIRSFDRTERLPVMPRHGGLMTRLYANAAEFCGRVFFGSPPGILAFFTYGTVLGLIIFEWSEPGQFKTIFGHSSTLNFFERALTLFGIVILPLLGAYFTLFTPAENPIVFDRKHRKIYWADTRERWRRFLLQPVTMQAFDWDTVRAEEQAIVVAAGSSIKRLYTLAFIAEDASGAEIGRYAIGTVIDPVPMLWEYIRRYMEGELLPKPEDALCESSAHFGYLQIVQNYLPWLHPPTWKKMGVAPPLRTMRLLRTLFAPVIVTWLPFYLLSKVLIDATEQKLLWPQAIIDNMGPLLGDDAAIQGYTRRIAQ